jgi:hypothetical protein
LGARLQAGVGNRGCRNQTERSESPESGRDLVPEEPKLFCWSETAVCTVLIGAACGRGTSKTRLVTLQGLPYRLSPPPPPPPPPGPLPTFGEINCTQFPYPTRTIPNPEFLSLSPCEEQTKLVIFSSPFSSVPPSHIAPVINAEPQRPLEQESKISGHLDQEPVRAWGWEKGQNPGGKRAKKAA